mmetsp:Transcript_134010/g.299550  ORF Transcript_134010/g.299550 Transcript_134010/m.299550 type:complete len:216 (+) Transcript_134010:3-650(+)
MTPLWRAGPLASAGSTALRTHAVQHLLHILRKDAHVVELPDDALCRPLARASDSEEIQGRPQLLQGDVTEPTFRLPPPRLPLPPTVLASAAGLETGLLGLLPGLPLRRLLGLLLGILALRLVQRSRKGLRRDAQVAHPPQQVALRHVLREAVEAQGPQCMPDLLCGEVAKAERVARTSENARAKCTAATHTKAPTLMAATQLRAMPPPSYRGGGH